MSAPRDRLYQLLPALHRIRDAERGGYALRDLLRIIEAEVDALEHDIGRLYENWYIETCEDWVVPYIADLLGLRGLPRLPPGRLSSRAQVANTIAYRRRKGTSAMLEQLARDATGWPARVVEFYAQVAHTQHMSHIRPGNVRTPLLRDGGPLARLGGPFNAVPHTVDVRRIDGAGRRGRFRLDHVGIYLWRLDSYRVERGDARRIDTAGGAHYAFHPLGVECPLFHRPGTRSEFTRIADESQVPGPLGRRALADDLARRGVDPDHSAYFDPAGMAFEIFENGEAVPPEDLAIVDLAKAPGPGEPGGRQPRVLVDPVRGQFTFASDLAAPRRVQVSYHYGSSGDVGGGPYSRARTVADLWPWGEPPDWVVGVHETGGRPPAWARTPALGPHRIVPTLAEALASWNGPETGRRGLIVLLDSRSHESGPEGTLRVRLSGRQELALIAATPSAGSESIPPDQLLEYLIPDGVWPHLRGGLRIDDEPAGAAEGEGKGASEPSPAGALFVSGLLIEGALTVAAPLASLHLSHTTLAPTLPAGSGAGLRITPRAYPASPRRLELTLERAIVGGIDIAPVSEPGTGTGEAALLQIRDSVLLGPVQAGAAAARIDRSTLLDKDDQHPAELTVLSLEASNSIFTGPVTVARRQVGCTRYSSVPYDSRVPRPYRCVREPAPEFTSRRYGDPAFGQLADTCAAAIRHGADDGSEMGVYDHLKQSQREAALRGRLETHMRLGFDAGIFHVT